MTKQRPARVGLGQRLPDRLASRSGLRGSSATRSASRLVVSCQTRFNAKTIRRTRVASSTMRLSWARRSPGRTIVKRPAAANPPRGSPQEPARAPIERSRAGRRQPIRRAEHRGQVGGASPLTSFARSFGGGGLCPPEPQLRGKRANPTRGTRGKPGFPREASAPRARDAAGSLGRGVALVRDLHRPARGLLGRVVHVHQGRQPRLRACDDDDAAAADRVADHRDHPRGATWPAHDCRGNARARLGGLCARDRQRRDPVHAHRLGRDEDRLGRGGDRERVYADLRRPARASLPQSERCDRLAAGRCRARPDRCRRAPGVHPEGGWAGARDAGGRRRVGLVRGRDPLQQKLLDTVHNDVLAAASVTWGRDLPPASRRGAGCPRRSRLGARSARCSRWPCSAPRSRSHPLPLSYGRRRRACQPRHLPAAR